MSARAPLPHARWPSRGRLPAVAARPALAPAHHAEAPQASPPEALPPEAGALGLVRLGAAMLAVPISGLREVAACPPSLHALAVAAPGLAGALNLRQRQVPVLDLGPHLGQPAQQPGKGKVVVILTWQHRRIGLLVDEVCGMAPAAQAQLQPVNLGPGALGACLTAALISLQDGRCASLLDLPALARLPGMPWVDDGAPDGHAAIRTGADAATGRVSLLLFDADPIPLAIEAMAVHTTVPEAEVRANALTSALCAGVIDFQGRQVPVLDTLQALGLGRLPAADRVSCLLLNDGKGGMVAVRLDRVRDITAVLRSAIAPMPAMAVLDVGLFAGVYRCPERGQHLVINPAGLLSNPWIRGLAETAMPVPALGTARRPLPGGSAATVSAAAGAGAGPGEGAGARAAATATATAGAGAGASQEESYLLFSAGQNYACRLKLITEIIRYPENMIALDGRGELLGLYMHQGRAVPLLCMSRLLGHAAPTDIAQVRVLLVERAGQMLGLAVQSISAIESARWRHQPKARSTPNDNQTAVQLGELIEVPTPDGNGRHTVQVLDLDGWLDLMTRADAALDLRQRLAQNTLECGIRAAGCDVI